MPKTRWRAAADELLLSKGPQPVGVVFATMEPLINPGKIDAMARCNRVYDEDGNLNQNYVGRRIDDRDKGLHGACSQVLGNAVRNKTWIVEDGMIRHRDWVAPVESPEPDAPGPATSEQPTEWVLPDLTGAFESLRLDDWQKAALVAAYVDEVGPGRRMDLANIGQVGVSANEFAALGLPGLKSKGTVLFFQRTWMEHSGGVRPVPGEPVVIPDIPFPSRTGGNEHSSKRTRKRDPQGKKPTPKMLDWERAGKTGDVRERVAWMERAIGSDEMDAAFEEWQRRKLAADMAKAKARKHPPRPGSNVVPLRGAG